MMMIRRPLLPSVLALSFLVGCAGEESSAPEAAPPSPAPAPAPAAPASGEKAPAEAAPAPEKKEADHAAKPPEPTPAPAKAEEKAPPAEDKKADAKPSLEGPSADAGAAKISDEDRAEIKKLPTDEQAAALAQAVCPVSTHGLGSMGVPLKVTVEGRTFYLCCEGCQKKVKNNPKAVVADLDKLLKK